MYKKTISLIMILLLFVSIPVMADSNLESSAQEENIAALVNGEQITMSELDKFASIQQVLMSLYQTNQDFAQVIFQSEAGNEVINEYRKIKLDELIIRKLMVEEAKKRDINISQEEKDKMFNDYIENIKRQNNLTDEKLLETLSNQDINSLEEYKSMFLEQSGDGLLLSGLQKQVLNDVQVSEEKVKSYYENNKSEFEVQEQVKASHILFKTDNRSEEEAKAEAEKVLTKLEEGKEFSVLAEEYSEGPTAQNGGELGYITKSDVVEGFAEAAFNMEAGEISNPVQSEFGYHIIKIDDKKEAGTKSFSEAKDSIESKLSNSKKQEVWDEFVRKLRDKAEIEIKL